MTRRHPRLGAHTSVAGGLATAFERATQIGSETIQIFTKNANQWKARPLTPAEIAAFEAARTESGVGPVFAHAAYLINLAAPDPRLWGKSLDAFVVELERCEALNLAGLVLHPGSYGNSDAASGMRRVADALSESFRRVGGRCEVWLETTAGQGSSLGATFEELRDIAAMVCSPERVAFCFDTSHVLVAGHELRTPAGYAATFEEWDRVLGLERLRAFHLNDSKKGLGSRVDRHAHIGQGELGLDAFRMLLNDARFVDRPMVLETPKGRDMAEDIRNLRVLRSLFEDGAGG